MCLPLLAIPLAVALQSVVGAVGAIGGIATGAGAAAGAGAAISASSLAIGSLASTLGVSVGTLGAGIGTLAATGISTGVSLAQQQKQATAASRGIEKQAMFEHQKEIVESGQRRKAAGARIEAAAIQGAQELGYAQVSGLSPAQVARYARATRASTLRNIDAARQNYEFGAQTSLLSQRASQINAGTRYKEIKSNLPGAGAVAVGIGSDLLNQGLKISNYQSAVNQDVQDTSSIF